MKIKKVVNCILFLWLTGSLHHAQDLPVLRGPYLGQQPPGLVPEIFAPVFVSTAAHEFSCCFSPDGSEFYFTRMDPNQNQNSIMVTKMIAGVWSAPSVAPFAGPFTFEPFITPDNRRVYFQTGKVVDGALLMYTMFSERTKDGWSAAIDPGEPFNPMKTMHVSVANDGTIYTTNISGAGSAAAQKGPGGTECLAMIRLLNGRYEKLEKMGPPLNRIPRSQHPWIAPDESYMIFSVMRPGQNPASVLFFTEKDAEGKWSEPQELRLGMPAGQAFVSTDGKYLFFTSMVQPRKGDIYWVSTKIIENLRQAKKE